MFIMTTNLVSVLSWRLFTYTCYSVFAKTIAIFVAAVVGVVITVVAAISAVSADLLCY